MIDLEMVIMVIITVSGAILAAALGWAESGEPFDARKFLSSIGRAIVAGVGIAVGLIAVPTEANALLYGLAFLSGAGVDVLGNRLAGAVGYGKK